MQMLFLFIFHFPALDNLHGLTLICTVCSVLTFISFLVCFLKHVFHPFSSRFPSQCLLLHSFGCVGPILHTPSSNQRPLRVWGIVVHLQPIQIRKMVSEGMGEGEGKAPLISLTIPSSSRLCPFSNGVFFFNFF